MKTKYLFTILLIFSISSLMGQNQTDKTENLPISFLNKKNQHSISVEVAALSYTYAHQFKPMLNLGIRAQIGYGFKLLLKSHHYLELNHNYDILKMELFYRLPFPEHFYFDFGFFTAAGDINDSMGLSYGIEGSAFYRIKKIHLGIRIENSFYSIENQSGYIGFSLIPFVFGFNF